MRCDRKRARSTRARMRRAERDRPRPRENDGRCPRANRRPKVGNQCRKDHRRRFANSSKKSLPRRTENGAILRNRNRLRRQRRDPRLLFFVIALDQISAIAEAVHRISGKLVGARDARNKNANDAQGGRRGDDSIARKAHSFWLLEPPFPHKVTERAQAIRSRSVRFAGE